MASAITHFVVGASVGLAMAPPRRWGLVLAAGVWAVAPDLDTLGMQAFHIPHGSLWSHRGLFHSPFVLAIGAFAVARLAAGPAWLKTGLILTCAAVTHPLLDMLTDGGSGVMLLFPFSTSRLFFPWRPIRVSPLSIARFFTRAGPILRSELPFNIAAVLLALLLRTRHTAASS